MLQGFFNGYVLMIMFYGLFVIIAHKKTDSFEVGFFVIAPSG